MKIANNLTPMANALIAANIVTTNFNYFNPMDVFDAELTNPTFKARCLGSYAWTLDSIIAQKAKQVFYALRQAAIARGEDISARDIDGYNAFITSIADMQAGDLYSEELGFEENTGALAQINLLLGLSEQAHDRAAEVSDIAQLKYEPRSIEQLIRDEKPRVDKNLALEDAAFEALMISELREHPTPAVLSFIGKSDADAAKMCTDTPTLSEAYLEFKKNPTGFELYANTRASAFKEHMDTDAQRAAERLLESQRIRPAVMQIISSVSRRINAGAVEAEDAQFHQLPVDLQKSIILRCSKLGNAVWDQIRTWTSLANDRSMIRIENHKMTQAFNKVLLAPKLNLGESASNQATARTRTAVLEAADA